MPKESIQSVFQCSECEKPFLDWNECFYHEEECQRKKHSTPESAHIFTFENTVYVWTLSRTLYKQVGDHLELVGSAGEGNIPRELDYLYLMIYDGQKWKQDEIPF
jgi:hypothetical protein